MAEEKRQGCQHEDKSSICFRCKNQYVCDEAQDPEVLKTTVCQPPPSGAPSKGLFFEEEK